VIAEAMSGHTYATGKGIDINHRPVAMAGDLGDLGPAIFAAFAIIAAIRHRDKTGVGQMIDVSQVDAMIAFNCCASVAYDFLKESHIKRRLNRPKDPNIIWGILPVKDGWIQLAGERGKGIENLKKALGIEELNKDLVAKKIKDMTRMEAFKWFADMDFPCAPILEAHESMFDPHLNEREMWKEVNHPVAGKYKVPNFPVKFTETPGEVKSAAPLLGQHTREILRGLLGKTDEELDDLEKQGAIVQWKPRK
jgi:CoA:oxalate CoA-transferase